MPAGTAAELFWSNVSQAAGRDRCAHPVRCKREGECSCYVVEALGLKALDKTVDWLRAQKPKRIANLLDFANNPRLIELCEQVIAWSVAPANRPN